MNSKYLQYNTSGCRVTTLYMILMVENVNLYMQVVKT